MPYGYLQFHYHTGTSVLYIPSRQSQTLYAYIYAMPSSIGSKFKVTFIIVDM